MKEFLKKYPAGEDCPFRTVMNRFGDKWSLLIIVTLNENGRMRYSELLKSIGDISEKMLTVTLRILEEDGFVARTIYPEIPPRVEYDLTELGKSLSPLVENLAQWTIAHLHEIIKARETMKKRK